MRLEVLCWDVFYYAKYDFFYEFMQATSRYVMCIL